MFTKTAHIIIISAFMCFCTNVYQQENSIYSNYYLNPFVVNPAVTGAEYYPVAELSVRKQWLNFPDAPTTFFLAGNYRIRQYNFYNPKGLVNKGPLKSEDHIGVGAALYRDNNGPLSATGIILSYAYHVTVNEPSELSFGISGIGTIYGLNNAALKPDQNGDTYLLNGNGNIFRANLNLGIYYFDNNYFAGLSANKILPDISNINNSIKEQPTYFFIGGYKFRRKETSFNFEPSLDLKKTGNEIIIVDAHAKLYIKKMNWFAVSYSTTGRMNFQFGLNLHKSLYAGYNYEYNLSSISSYTLGSHEIYLGINLGLIGVEGIRRTVDMNEKKPIPK